jgi:putative spermidine/putrescine transport system substrate-binding protein
MPTKKSATRRQVLRYSSAGGVAILAGCTSTSSGGNSGSNGGNKSGATVGNSGKKFSGQTLTVSGYGGKWKNIFENVVAKPFEEKTGAKINVTTSGSAAEAYAKIKASGGKPGFDLAVLTGAEIILGKQDSNLARIPEKYGNVYGIIDKYNDITLPYGGIHGVQYLSLFTHEKKNKGSADSWKTFWNEGNAGHVILIHPSNLAGIFFVIQAARMQGGGINNIDPGFKKTANLCPDQVLTTIKSSSEIFNYTNTESVWAAPFWSGRALISILERNQPYTMSVGTEGAPYLLNCLGVPSGANKKELAFAFMNHWISPNINAKWSMNYNVGPSHPAAVEKLSSKYQKLVPNPQMPNFKKLYYPDPSAIANNRKKWTKRWVRQIGSKC